MSSINLLNHRVALRMPTVWSLSRTSALMEKVCYVLLFFKSCDCTMKGNCSCDQVPFCVFPATCLCVNVCWFGRYSVISVRPVPSFCLPQSSSQLLHEFVYLLLLSFVSLSLFMYWNPGNRQMKVTAEPDPCNVFILSWVTPQCWEQWGAFCFKCTCNAW